MRSVPQSIFLVEPDALWRGIGHGRGMPSRARMSGQGLRARDPHSASSSEIELLPANQASDRPISHVEV